MNNKVSHKELMKRAQIEHCYRQTRYSRAFNAKIGFVHFRNADDLNNARDRELANEQK
jgi:hypothetical protein